MFCFCFVVTLVISRAHLHINDMKRHNLYILIPVRSFSILRSVVVLRCVYAMGSRFFFVMLLTFNRRSELISIMFHINCLWFSHCAYAIFLTKCIIATNKIMVSKASDRQCAELHCMQCHCTPKHMLLNCNICTGFKRIFLFVMTMYRELCVYVIFFSHSLCVSGCRHLYFP